MITLLMLGIACGLYATSFADITVNWLEERGLNSTGRHPALQNTLAGSCVAICLGQYGADPLFADLY